VAGGATLTVIAGAALVADGFELNRILQFLVVASWCWLYRTLRAYEVSVEGGTITFRRVVGRRSRPTADLTRALRSTQARSRRAHAGGTSRR
jgi:hypothetical protein